ncbi:uncharacterized protein A1O9_04515 [Exophiala aquamarina CBS 119918]|uniref:Large ribosomal subunit protein uL29m n=1 Tax=Exophiala aquamarina CBS 119918 TaxID=1182545 RepID=A0A072PHR1_9EURO|nr:uncharacterized protein A1O9_04515 [Exophiala aquamarina CBS 119918]KEF59669.1 hypothetical protein A1O9_04515 [Exophiala aquamarina CBS 119918]
MAAVTRGISSASGRSTSIPVFLVPAFSRPCSSRPVTSSRSFSSSEPRGKRQTKAGETNKKRGVSAMRGTGPLVNRGLWAYPLPEPVARSRVPKQTDYEDTADHGLWQFFHADRKALVPPEEESSHGRAWSYGELSIKSFEDLHKLYWLCIKEQNQILTRSREMSRVRAGFGDLELEEKRKVVSRARSCARYLLSYDEPHPFTRRYECYKTA